MWLSMFFYFAVWFNNHKNNNEDVLFGHTSTIKIFYCVLLFIVHCIELMNETWFMLLI